MQLTGLQVNQLCALPCGADGRALAAAVPALEDLTVHEEEPALLCVEMLASGTLTRLTALKVFVPAEEEPKFWAALGGLRRLRLLSLDFDSTRAIRRWLHFYLQQSFDRKWKRPVQVATSQCEGPTV